MDKEEFLKRMGQKIRDLRNDRAWTLYDMEALTDIDSGDLSKISRAFEISIDKLLDFDK